MFYLVLYPKFCVGVIVSFGTYFSGSSFGLALCVHFYIFEELRSSATSPRFESAGLVWVASCGVHQHRPLWSPEHGTPGSSPVWAVSSILSVLGHDCCGRACGWGRAAAALGRVG